MAVGGWGGAGDEVDVVGFAGVAGVGKLEEGADLFDPEKHDVIRFVIFGGGAGLDLFEIPDVGSLEAGADGDHRVGEIRLHLGTDQIAGGEAIGRPAFGRVADDEHREIVLGFHPPQLFHQMRGLGGDLDMIGEVRDVVDDNDLCLVPLDLVDHRRGEIRSEVGEAVIVGLGPGGQHLDADQVGGE